MAVAKIVAILLVIAAICYLGFVGLVQDRPDPEGIAMVEIAGETFTLDIAADRDSITQGLMGVEKIKEDGGMIFAFARPHMPGFWMKNCLTDIDLLYLDEMGKVVEMHEMKKEPPRADNESLEDYENRLVRYRSDVPIRFAIELKPGSIRRLGITEGDLVEFDLRRLKRLAR